MNLYRALAALGGVVGATAAGNAALARRADDLPAPLPGTERSYRFRGIDVSYTELGDPGDRTVLLLHGMNAAATSQEFEPIVAGLAAEYHVVAPDFPGFGRSERPSIAYDADMYTDFVREFADDVTPGAIAVASSLSGSYAAIAARETGVFSKLVLICPTATTVGIRRPKVRALLRSPLLGTAIFNVLASKPSIRYFNADHGYYDPENIAEDVVEYEWLSAHQPGARFAPASFISGFLDPEEPLEQTLADVDAPVMLVWGRDADITPLDRGRAVAEMADTGLIVFDRAKLLPHVEYPEKFVEVVSEEVPVKQ